MFTKVNRVSMVRSSRHNMNEDRDHIRKKINSPLISSRGVSRSVLLHRFEEVISWFRSFSGSKRERNDWFFNLLSRALDELVVILKVRAEVLLELDNLDECEFLIFRAGAALDPTNPVASYV